VVEFDTTACNKKIAKAFIVLMKTQDIHQAVASIVALQVPDSLQPDQLCDLLRFIVEANVEIVRSIGYQFIVAICLEGCWSHASLVKGFENFEQLCAAKEVQAPDLANILFAEMVPAFTPLVLQGLLPRSLSLQGYRESAESSAIPTDRAIQVVQSKNRRKRNSLIDQAAEQRRQEEKGMEATLALQEEHSMQMASSCYMGQAMAPSIYYCAPSVLMQ
jgi:hypothetical protein